MTIFAASFHGHRKHALGIAYRINDQVEAENIKAAELALYDKYEHISRLVLTPINPERKPATCPPDSK